MQSSRTKLRQAQQGSTSFQSYVTYFENLALKARLNVNTQLEVFVASLSPDILASWNPITITTTWRELVTTLRIHLQVRENLKQAQQNAKKKAVTPRSSSTTKSSSDTSKTTFGRAPDPIKPLVYVTNTNSPTYQDRLSKGWEIEEEAEEGSVAALEEEEDSDESEEFGAFGMLSSGRDSENTVSTSLAYFSSAVSSRTNPSHMLTEFTIKVKKMNAPIQGKARIEFFWAVNL
ncbi:hypothetical protein SeLEV6574_g07481 [Synchytrium endobioticum]|uniref:Retrotransposon gag domain-containing protein n=1 Tax=Synchytrium endobioticum TaxID=286115 RepID=A0A507CHZ8_9FUNG|nr:hypothetical protein SeLEV6574_g07481 [Synchytrium endobioticum]